MTTSHTDVHTEGHVLHGAGFYDRCLMLVTLGRESSFRRRIVEAAGIAPGERVLDVGCGTGTLALLAAQRVGSTGAVVGIDPSADMIARARAKATKRSLSAGATVRFELAAIERLPLSDGEIDVVVSSLVFHHLPGELQRAGLGEIRRVLAAGGRLTIVDFPAGGPRLHRVVGHLIGHGAPHHAHQAHSLERVAELARELGFEQVVVSRFKPRFLNVLHARTAAQR